MTPRTTRWRMTAAITACSMTLSGVPAFAAPPPIANQGAANPPARVGRLAHYTGTVSFHTADETQWSPATLNYPLTTGNALWTEPGATAVTDVGGNIIALDSSTELDIATLDDHSFVGSTPQGELYLNLQQVPNGDTYTIQTPRGAVQMAASGRYDVVAGDTDHPTTVTVVQGSAQITGTNLALQVGPGQTASINGADNFQGSVGPMAQDPFLTSMLAQEQPRPRAGAPIPPVVAQMTGYQDLAQNGAWQETPQYGTVWYPRVETGWVPYRQGHWSYVAPWGWTWIDDASWGFAPFHYGRWIDAGDRWGWVPAEPPEAGVPVEEYPAPVYAPALVSFMDIAGAAAVGAAVGLAAGALLGGGGRDRSVGWVPLGPNEPYYPPYSNRLDYVRRLNGPNIRNINQTITNNSIHNVTNITNNHVVVQNFINRGGATVVPAAAMARSMPIAASAHTLAPDQFTQARTQFAAPIAPTAATAGVTPAVGRRFNFTPAARPTPATGPAINPAAFHAPAPHGAAPAFVPPLRPAAGAPARPAEPTRAAAPGPAIEPGHPGAAPGPNRPATPGETNHPGAPGPAIEPGRAGVPATPGEANHPGVPGPAIEPGHPGAAPGPNRPATPGETNHPGAPGPAIEPGRPGVPNLARPGTPEPNAPARGPEPNRATAPGPAIEPGHPAVAGPALRPPAPNEAPHPEAPHPEAGAQTHPGVPGEPNRGGAVPASRPAAVPPPAAPHAAEVARPAPQAAPARPPAAAAPPAQVHAAPAPVPHVAPAAPPVQIHAAPAPVPHVAPAPRPAPPPRPAAPPPQPAPRPAPPRPAMAPPRPAPAAPRPAPAPHPAPPPHGRDDHH